MDTFLFTDIESSTRLWEEHPNSMAESLKRHDAILRTGITGNRGNVIKTTGDGMVAVFGSASEAVQSTLDIQSSLAAEVWNDTGPLRVRMGLHTGDAELREGDYFGPTMNRASRIMAAGHGGQILLSAAVASHIEGRLPNRATLSDLGAHRLKDLTSPEHIYQLVDTDLPGEFPDLATLDSRPNNLPSQMSAFVGRASELDAIQIMLEAESTRLLTLAGPGGAGKTRLALQIGAEQVNKFRDGVFFVDVSLERDPDSAFEGVVRTLNLPIAGDGNPLDVLKARLRDRNMLLILDNFEQVVSAADGINDLLQNCSELKIVITSRETLRIRVERVFPVPPLSLPDPRQSTPVIADSEAVQLFVERAVAAAPDFALIDANSATIAEICLRLDGLPLAIELAAARLNVFTPADLLSRLRERLDVLGAGGRDLPDRQRTLWGAIGWSYELLDSDERAVFEMMAVFSKTSLLAIEAVAAVALDTDSALDSISSLVDKSLLRKVVDEQSATFSMLLMIKEFAEERLGESPEQEAVIRLAHARYFSDFAVGLEERLRGPDRHLALTELESEVGNLRTAWRYWVTQGDLKELFKLLDGLWALHEARGWYHAAIELAEDTLGVLSNADPSPALANEEMVLRTSLARALMAVRGYDVEVEKAFKSALALIENIGTAEQTYPVLRALASYYTLTGDLPEAAAVGQRLLDLGASGDDEAITLEGHYVIGTAVSFLDLDVSLSHLERAIELYDPARHGGNRFRLGPNTGVLARTSAAMVYWLAGDLHKSVSHIENALTLARDIDHPYSVAYALYHNGYLAFLRHRFEDCLTHSAELAEVAEANDYEIWKTLAVVLEGAGTAGLGNYGKGLSKTEVGIALYSGLTTPPVFWPFLLALRAVVHALAGKGDSALRLVEEAIEIATETVAPPGLEMLRADILSMTSDPDIAKIEATYLREIEMARHTQLRLIELQATTRLVTLRRKLGVSPDGADELAKVYSSFADGPPEHDVRAAAQLLESD